MAEVPFISNKIQKWKTWKQKCDKLDSVLDLKSFNIATIPLSLLLCMSVMQTDTHRQTHSLPHTGASVLSGTDKKLINFFLHIHEPPYFLNM